MLATSKASHGNDYRRLVNVTVGALATNVKNVFLYNFETKVSCTRVETFFTFLSEEYYLYL